MERSIRGLTPDSSQFNMRLLQHKKTMHKLKLIEIGDAVGAIFPKELLAQMRLKKGDAVYVTETPDGLRITAYSPALEEQMRMGQKILKERYAVLRDLQSAEPAPEEELAAGRAFMHDFNDTFNKLAK